jgi:hypothetical protein
LYILIATSAFNSNRIWVEELLSSEVDRFTVELDVPAGCSKFGQAATSQNPYSRTMKQPSLTGIDTPKCALSMHHCHNR